MTAPLRRAGREVALPAALVGGLLLAGYATQEATGRTFMRPLSFAFTSTFLPIVFICFLYGGAWTLVRARTALAPEKRSGRMAWARSREGALSADRVAALTLSALVIALLFDTFGQWKTAIPLLSGFTWDRRLADLDRTVHGTDPWRLLQPWLGRPGITLAVDRLYALWLPTVAVFTLWQSWHPDVQARRRFLLAFTLVWIVLGVGLAHIFGSAGPCYFDRVAPGPDPYAPLMAYLRTVDAAHPLVNLRAQAWLWELHESGQGTPYTGISAMPSLHVAIPVLFVLAAWRLNRGVAIALIAYAAVIFLGSVHLAWHYALDGEISAILAAAIWLLAGYSDPTIRARPAGRARTATAD